MEHHIEDHTKEHHIEDYTKVNHIRNRSMNRYIVFMKQVPLSTKIEMDAVTKTLIRSSAAARTNPDDLHALMAAVEMRTVTGGEVIAVSMGPEKAKEVLREALQLGADKAILISDRAFAGSDTLCTSLVLSKAAQYIGDYKALFFGRMAIDGDTAQVGPEVAAHLNLPQVTNMERIERFSETDLVVKRSTACFTQLLQVSFPCVLMVSKNVNSLPHPTLKGWEAAQEKEITVLNAEALHIHADEVGLDASPTRVVSTTVPQSDRQIEWMAGTEQLAGKLTQFM